MQHSDMPELAALTISLGEILLIGVGIFRWLRLGPKRMFPRGSEDPGPGAIFLPVVHHMVHSTHGLLGGSVYRGVCSGTVPFATALLPPCLLESTFFGGPAVFQTDGYDSGFHR
jgi:hypothetical protein